MVMHDVLHHTFFKKVIGIYISKLRFSRVLSDDLVLDLKQTLHFNGIAEG